jgi:hypothetical protein
MKMTINEPRKDCFIRSINDIVIGLSLERALITYPCNAIVTDDYCLIFRNNSKVGIKDVACSDNQAFLVVIHQIHIQ